METAQFHLPPKLDLTDGNLADAFRKWKRQLEVYMEASGTTNKPKQRQTAIILYCAGAQVLEVYDHFQVDEEDDKTIQRKFLKRWKSTVTRDKIKFIKVFASGTFHSTSFLMCSNRTAFPCCFV